MESGGSRDSELESNVLGELAAIVTDAATRIHAEHRRGATRWAAAASVLGLAGTAAMTRQHPVRAAALVAGLLGSLAAAGHHRRLAELSRPGD